MWQHERHADCYTPLGPNQVPEAASSPQAALTPDAEVTLPSGQDHQRVHAEPTPDLKVLLEGFYAGRSQTTLASYRERLDAFDAWCRSLGMPGFLPLLRGSQGDAHRVVSRYRAYLLELGRSPATVNAQLVAIRSAFAFASTCGVMPWQLRVRNVRTTAYRDTRGCGEEGFRRLLAAAADQQDEKRRLRDTALLWMLFAPALRVSEALAITIADVHLGSRTISVIGKGRREPEAITVPPPCWAALLAWLEVRGLVAGPVFISLPPGAQGHRMSRRSAHHLVARLGDRAGVRAHPHALRHAGVTAALDLGIPVRDVQRFSRHADLKTLLRYDDNRADIGGAVAEQVAATITRTPA